MQFVCQALIGNGKRVSAYDPTTLFFAVHGCLCAHDHNCGSYDFSPGLGALGGEHGEGCYHPEGSGAKY